MEREMGAGETFPSVQMGRSVAIPCAKISKARAFSVLTFGMIRHYARKIFFHRNYFGNVMQ